MKRAPARRTMIKEAATSKRDSFWMLQLLFTVLNILSFCDCLNPLAD